MTLPSVYLSVCLSVCDVFLCTGERDVDVSAMIDNFRRDGCSRTRFVSQTNPPEIRYPSRRFQAMSIPISLFSTLPQRQQRTSISRGAAVMQFSTPRRDRPSSAATIRTILTVSDFFFFFSIDSVRSETNIISQFFSTDLFDGGARFQSRRIDRSTAQREGRTVGRTR